MPPSTHPCEYGYIHKTKCNLCNISVLNCVFTAKLQYIYSTYTVYIHSKNGHVKCMVKIIVYLNAVVKF